MKGFIRFTWCFLLFGLSVRPAQAAFSSMYVFGDTVSATTSNAPSQFYYGRRYSNGRVWVELLAQELNLSNNFWYSNNSSIHLSYTNLSAFSTNWSCSSNNLSYFDHNTGNLLAELNHFSAPNGVSNALFVVWVNDADLYDAIWVHDDGTNRAKWANDINVSMTNHWKIITNLYAKGVRTLLMPNAVDMSKVPNFSAYAETNFIRQECIAYNVAFNAMLTNAMVSLPGLKIYEPDFFSLLDDLLAHPALYGVTNALEDGHTIDALDDLSMTDYSLNGPGANYIFWDYLDPTARVHKILADLAKQLIAPAQTSKITALGGSNRLDLANVPMGLNGIVQSSTNLALTNWTFVASFPSTNDSQSVFVPASGPMQFYRLSFPFTWTWP